MKSHQTVHNCLRSCAPERRAPARPVPAIRYGTERYFIGTAIAGWSVGIKPQSNGLVEVWFSRLLLGHIAPDTASFLAVRTDSQEAGQPEDHLCNL